MMEASCVHPNVISVIMICSCGRFVAKISESAFKAENCFDFSFRLATGS